jgi:hypothetical protein
MRNDVVIGGDVPILPYDDAGADAPTAIVDADHRRSRSLDSLLAQPIDERD